MPGILLDISRLFHRKLRGRRATGIDRVTLEYVRHYGGRARAVLTLGGFQSLLSRGESERAFRMVLDPQRGAALDNSGVIAAACIRWWTKPDVSDCVLIDTSQQLLERGGYGERFARSGARPVFFVHDVIPITHSEYCRPGERERHAARMRTALTRGQGIIVNSRVTLDALTRFAHAEGLRMPPAAAAPLASSLPQVGAGRRPMKEPYFVVVGTIEPRKNHRLLLHLWRSLAGRMGEAAPRLVVIGQRGWECEDVVDLLERCGQLRGFVLERSACGDAELLTYLRHAQALLCPSFVEGFGIPLAEALSAAAPVIASDLPVFRDFAGEVPEYADPLDGRRWMELIVEYARPDSGRRAAQLERMKGFRATTWGEHFQAVDAFIEGI